MITYVFQLLGSIYMFLLKLFFIGFIGLSILYYIIETIDDFKEKRKLKRENKYKEP